MFRICCIGSIHVDIKVLVSFGLKFVFHACLDHLKMTSLSTEQKRRSSQNLCDVICLPLTQRFTTTMKIYLYDMLVSFANLFTILKKLAEIFLFEASKKQRTPHIILAASRGRSLTRSRVFTSATAAFAEFYER